MMIKYAIALAVLLAVAAFVSWAFLPVRPCRTTAPDTYDSASACGCTPAKASLRSSAFGCTGAASHRCVAPAGSVAPFPSGCASLTRMHIRCS